MEVYDVLKLIEKGKIKPEEGIAAIKRLIDGKRVLISKREVLPARRRQWLGQKSHGLKLYIEDVDSKFRLNLPPIPLFLLNALFLVGFKLMCIFQRYMPDDARKILEDIDPRDLRAILWHLRHAGKFDMVDICAQGKTKIKIRLI